MFDLIDSILKSVDDQEKTAGIFLDLSKAFDIVDHNILLTKLHAYGIRGNSHKWLSSFLKNRKQYVEISVTENNNVKNYKSVVKTINYSVIQGSLMGPVLFLLYINDLPLYVDESAHPVGYADDSNFKVTGANNKILNNNIQKLLIKVKEYFDQNGLKLNVEKTEILQFQNLKNKNERLEVVNYEDDNIELSYSTKFLGIIIDQNLRWVEHIDQICKKLSSCVFAIKELKQDCQIECLVAMYYANFHCHLKYGVLCWGNSTDCKRVFKLQKKVVRIICGAKYRAECRELFKILNILTLPCVYIMECAKKVSKNMEYFKSHEVEHKYDTRNSGKIKNMYTRTEMYKKGPLCGSITIYNNIPIAIRSQSDQKLFERQLKIFLLNKQYYSVAEFLKDDHMQ